MALQGTELDPRAATKRDFAACAAYSAMAVAEVGDDVDRLGQKRRLELVPEMAFERLG